MAAALLQRDNIVNEEKTKTKANKTATAAAATKSSTWKAVTDLPPLQIIVPYSELPVHLLALVSVKGTQ